MFTVHIFGSFKADDIEFHCVFFLFYSGYYLPCECSVFRDSYSHPPGDCGYLKRKHLLPSSLYTLSLSPWLVYSSNSLTY